MPAAMRQQGVGVLKWRFVAKFKENGKQKRRKRKPAANFSEWTTTIMLNILSALISAALIKLLGLN